MVYEAPDLITPISVRSYRQDIDANFVAIGDALSEIENELQSTPRDISWGLHQWIPTALNAEGPVGRLSFYPRFASDYKTLYIDPKSDGHLAVFGGLWHKLMVVEAWQQSLSPHLTGDGNCRLCVGLGSLGAPQVQVLVSKGETDESDVASGIQLRLYDFRLYRSGATYWVTKLRRRSGVLMDGATFGESGARSRLAMSCFRSGVLPTVTGDLAEGVIVPFAATVEGAYFRLGTRPPSGQTVTVELWRPSVANVLSGSASWTNATSDGTVRYVAPTDPVDQVAAGSFLGLRLTAASASGVAASLNATILLRPTLLPE